MTILAAAGIGISFGGVKAIDDVGFSVKEGQIFSIIGPNGKEMIRNDDKDSVVAYSLLLLLT